MRRANIPLLQSHSTLLLELFDWEGRAFSHLAIRVHPWRHAEHRWRVLDDARASRDATLYGEKFRIISQTFDEALRDWYCTVMCSSYFYKTSAFIPPAPSLALHHVQFLIVV